MSNFQLYHGDCLEILPTLEAGSVDMVFSDPPYKKEFNHLYGEMAKAAKAPLKKGGLLLTLSGHHSLDIIIPEMAAHLDYYWMGGMPNSAGSVARYHPKQLMMSWKPCIWFSNGKADKHDYVFDMFKSKRIKRVNHIWEQGVSWFVYYIEKLTNPGDTILDPFMGSGTTGVACHQTGRNFIGIEIDETYFKIAEQRIQDAQRQPLLDGFDV